MKRVALVAALLASAPACAQQSPFFTLSQQWQAAQQHLPYSGPSYAPASPSYSGPQSYAPYPQYHNYTFPNGQSLSCANVGMATYCY